MRLFLDSGDIYCGGSTCGIHVSVVGDRSCWVSFVPRVLQHYNQRGRKISVDISIYHRCCSHGMQSRVYDTVKSVYRIIWLVHAAAAGLLLWAQQPGDVDRLLHGWQLAA